VIFSYLLSKPNLDTRLACVVQSGFTISNRDTSRDAVGRAKTCLADMLSSGDRQPVAKAFYAHLHTEPFDRKSPPEVALRLAQEAVTEAPRNSIVHRSLMVAYWNAGQIEPALREGAIAVSRNALNYDVAAAYGFRLVSSGAYREGVEMLTAAMLELHPGDSCWDLGLFLGHFAQGHDAVAAQVGIRLPRAEKAEMALARVVSLKLLGRSAEAREDLRKSMATFPWLAKDPVVAFTGLRLPTPLMSSLRATLTSLQ
jgi:tetratricopeptide (TPR) repeat protein